MENDGDFVDVMLLHFCIGTCCHHGSMLSCKCSAGRGGVLAIEFYSC